MAVETRPELVGKRFLCLAVGEEARPERREGGRSRRGWRAGVIRAVSHRDCRNPDLAVRARPSSPESAPAPPLSRSRTSGYLWHLALLANWRSRPPASSRRICPRPNPHGVAASLRVASRWEPGPSWTPQRPPGPRPGSPAPGPEGRPRLPVQLLGGRGDLSERRVCAGRWGGGGDPVAGVRPAGISSRSSLNSAEAGDVKLTREADEGGRTEGDLCLPVSPGIAVCF